MTLCVGPQHRNHTKRYGSISKPAPVPARRTGSTGTYPQAAAEGVGGFAIIRDPMPPGADPK